MLCLDLGNCAHVRASLRDVCELLCANCDTLCDCFFGRVPKVPKLVNVVEVPPPPPPEVAVAQPLPTPPSPSPTPSEVAVAYPSPAASVVAAGENIVDDNFGGEE